MNRLPPERQAQVVAALVEGNSIRATVRMTGVAKNTVTKLLVDLGAACAAYMDEHLRELDCERIQCDEIWAFCQAKAKNVPAEHRGEFGWGDVWTWVAIDADTKLVPTFLIGDRSSESADAFVADLAIRLARPGRGQRVQITTDGYSSYVGAVETAFGANADYAMLMKQYANPPQGPETRYSPATVIGVESLVVMGAPDRRHVSTSYVERQNLTMRMGMRRFTRLTNGFSKKVDNLWAAVALHFMHYDYCRPHKTLSNPYPCTPAMAAGKADRVWTVADLVALLA